MVSRNLSSITWFFKTLLKETLNLYAKQEKQRKFAVLDLFYINTALSTPFCRDSYMEPILVNVAVV